jgi:lysophospholipase L1-like esterase
MLNDNRTWLGVIAALLITASVFTFDKPTQPRPPLLQPLPVEDPSGVALHNFHAALTNSLANEAAPLTRIVHYGDSHSAAEWFAAPLRQHWLEDYGAVYENFGSNGARATKPLQWNWTALAEQYALRPPALIIVGYGTNEAGDAELNLKTYQQTFAALLERFQQAAPEASLLVLAPPDRAVRRNGRWQSLTTLPGLIETQRRTAFAHGAAFWNLYQAMGGAGSIQRWRGQQLAQSDHVHLTAAGYRLVANTLYSELRRTYDQFATQ